MSWTWFWQIFILSGWAFIWISIIKSTKRGR